MKGKVFHVPSTFHIFLTFNHTDSTNCFSLFFIFKEVVKVGKELGIKPVIIRGEELQQRGFGGKKDCIHCSYAMLGSMNVVQSD